MSGNVWLLVPVALVLALVAGRMLFRVVVFAAVVAAVVFGARAVALTTVHCHAAGSAPWAVPDNRPGCTPGRTEKLTRARACDPGREGAVTVATKREVARRYGLDYASLNGDRGEWDHSEPDFNGGRETAGNVWFEFGHRPNPKDYLESYVRRRVCVTRDMSPRTARRIFTSRWTHAYAFFYDRGMLPANAPRPPR